MHARHEVAVPIHSRTRASRAFAALVLLLACGLASLSPRAVTAAAARPVAQRRATPDSVALTLDRWVGAVGGWEHLDHAPGVHLNARITRGGVPGPAELWVSRDGFREVDTQGTTLRERVRQGSHCWGRDWNGKTRELQGRDLADGITEAFVYALAYAGFTAAELAAAGAQDGGEDSTRTLRIVRFTPRGGSRCDVYFDAESGLPVRAVRTHLGDELATTFSGWRLHEGLSMPFALLLGAEEGEVDTLEVASATRAAIPESMFTHPPDAPTDVRLPAGVAEVTVPFNFENEHIMVDCSVNGRPPVWFMFDTGADVSVVNSARLEEYGLSAFGASTASGGGNSASVSFTTVPSLKIGAAELVGQRNTVMDLTGLERVYGMPLGGILGYDFASRFVIVVDYDQHMFHFHVPRPGAGVPRGDRVPFLLEGGHPHVHGTISVDDSASIEADFIVDSGAAESANLTTPFVRANQLLQRARRKPTAAPSVMAGSEKQFFAQTSVRGHLKTLRLGNTLVREIPVNLQQGSSGMYASTSFSGTIGERILRRFTTTYDYPHSAIVLEPNAEYARPFTPRMTFGMTLLADGPGYPSFMVAGVGKDSPAAIAGFRAGDQIVALDGQPAAKLRLAGIRAALAEDGARHTVDVAREGQPPQRLSFTVEQVSIEDR